jgi:hypothetical protein
MHKKNSIIPANNPVNSITGQDLATEMVELSDEALSQVCGRINNLQNQFIFNRTLMFGRADVAFHYYYLAPPPDLAIDPEVFHN